MHDIRAIRETPELYEQAWAAKGSAGPISIELFLPKFRDGDPFAVASEIRQKCETVMRKARFL